MRLLEWALLPTLKAKHPWSQRYLPTQRGSRQPRREVPSRRAVSQPPARAWLPRVAHCSKHTCRPKPWLFCRCEYFLDVQARCPHAKSTTVQGRGWMGRQGQESTSSGLQMGLEGLHCVPVLGKLPLTLHVLRCPCASSCHYSASHSHPRQQPWPSA